MPPIDLDGGAIRVGRSTVTTTEEREKYEFRANVGQDAARAKGGR